MARDPLLTANVPAEGMPAAAFSFLQGGGKMGALIRQKDWTDSLLGDANAWPQSLRSAVSICLGSGFPIAIYWGPELALLYNDAWSPIPGEKHPWALGQPAAEVWPEIWDTIGPLFQQVVTTGEATRSKDQLLAMRRHGFTEECYFDYTFTPLRGESGRVDGIFNAVLETTERVIGERRLRIVRELAGRVSEARTVDLACQITAHTLSSAAADIPFALLYLLSRDGTEAVLAGTAGLDPGTPASPICISVAERAAGGSLVPESAWPVAQVLRSGAAELVANLAARFAPLSGGPWPEPPNSALVLPISRAGRELSYGVLVAGLSPRRTLDSDYRAFFDIVSSHIAQALANAEGYEEERKRAEALAEIDRAKTAFFSNVSHEFRTPLTLMLGPLEEMLAMNGALPPAVMELVSVTHRNGLRLRKLVNSLLDFSRIEASRMQACYESADLASLTAELASTFRSAVEKAGLQLAVECPPLRSDVYVDREMWEKIVLNLLSNAFKYTFAGKITVRLSEQDNLAKLSVEDTGIGIPEHELPHLFERFHRVADAHGRTQEGSGIGLALAADLVKLHGGTVQVESILGQGSTFTVFLPFGSARLPRERVGSARSLSSTALRLESYAEEAAHWSRDACGRGAPPVVRQTGLALERSASKGRVLVADDNADMRDYAARLLSGRYEVETASNGEEALARVLKHPPDLVLSDVMMPRLDGFGLLRAVRSNPGTSALPLILLSARAGEEARIEGLDSGASDYLVKPFTARELLARVDAHIDMARVRQQAAAREAELRAEAEAARDRAVGVLESITDAFAVFDREWRFIYVNAEAERLLGMRREELLGKSHWEIFPAALGTVVEQEYRRAARDLVSVQFEYFHEPWKRWFSTKGYPSREGGLSIYFHDITEQKEAAAKLRESQERLRAIYDGTYEYIGLLATDGTLLEANRASLEFAGSTRDDVVGLPFWDGPWFTGTPGAPEQVRQAVARAAAGDFVRFEAKLRRPSGEWPAFDISLHPIRNEHGDVVLIVPEGRNITERKLIEERLQQQWHAFDTALSNTPDFTYTFDLEGRFTYVNRALLSLWRKPLEEALGKNFFELEYPPKLAERLQSEIQQVIETKQPLRNDTPFAGPTGETRHYEYIFVPVLGSDGRVSAVAGSTRDITDRERMEKALAASEEKLQRVFAQAPVAIVAFRGREFIVEMVNPFYQALLDGRELVGRRFADAMPELGQHVWDALHRVFDTGEPFTANEWHIPYDYNRDGVPEDHWFNVAYNPLREFDGTVSGVIAVLTDVTVQVQARQELEQVNRQLEEFSFVASHDLQEPLRMVNIYAQLMLRQFGAAEGELGQYAGFVRQGVLRMETLLGDLLTFSRAVHTEALLPVGAADLAVSLSEALSVLQSLIDENGAVITCGPLPAIRGDTQQLAHVFQNLLSNALKYRKSGLPPDIRISAEQRGNVWIVSVQDNGIGFEPQYSERIFGLFKRLHGKEYPGTGLGLAICQRIVARYGGQMWAEGRPGEGATFSFSLPGMARDSAAGQEEKNSR